MKILFITSNSINGGAQKHIREMFKSLTGLGHEMYIVAPQGWLIDELNSFGDKVIPLDIGFKTIPELKKIIDKIKPDITNTFILSGGVFGVAAWKKKRYGKIFVTVNNPVIYPGISTAGKLLYPRMYRWMSKYASAFLVKADKVRDEVAEVIRNKKPVISIKNGIDFSIFDKDKEYPNIREEFGIKIDDIVVTNVGALDTRKGQQYLIEASVEIRKHYPIHTWLVGEGDDRGRLSSLVKEKEAEKYIHFLGRRSDINTVLSNSNIFVLSSLHEGLPNALMEAMAMGLPCIATDVGGVTQLIRSSESGIVINPCNPSEIVNGLKYYLDNPILANHIGNNAYKTMFDVYKQDSISKELIEIYERL